MSAKSMRNIHLSKILTASSGARTVLARLTGEKRFAFNHFRDYFYAFWRLPSFLSIL